MPTLPERSKRVCTTAIEEKAALRRRMKQMPPSDWTPLLERFLELPQVEQAKTFLLFYGVDGEPDTRGVITQLLRQGKTVALPRCLPGRKMEARVITGLSDLTGNYYGIPEPGDHCSVIVGEALDVILVPHLCCDREGYRLGHGGGYYDRYLQGFRGFTVALCPVERLVERVPREEYDCPVELVLTEG